MALLNGVLLTLLFTGVLVWKVIKSRKLSASIPLPPSPRADPIIGHVRIVPTSRPELSYQKWAKEYNSDVLYLNFMGQPAVILNSAQSAVDLMDKRSNIYSNRPNFHFFEESGWRDVLTFSQTGPAFRKHRKMFQNAFSPTNIVQYRDKQESQAHALVRQILQKPGQWRGLLTKFASSIILAIAYGIQITDDNDPYVVLVEKVAWLFANGGPPGATFVDIAPFIRRLPAWVKFFPSLNFARYSYPIVREFNEAPFAAVKRGFEDGAPEISFARRMLEEKHSANTDDDAANLTEDDIKGAAGTMYAAGADTTLSTLVVFVLCMVLNPEAQEKGRQEIDRMIGRDRLPNFSDRGKLPYIDKIFFEVARWHPVAPLGVPHKSSKDDVYKNMFIPKGSLVMANAYAITHDPSVYTDPDKFDPDRYVPVSEGGAGEPLPVGHFGFGRRVCPGQHLATESVWIVIGTMLATLKISKVLDAEGNGITPDPKMTTGLESHPEEFPCVIEPRDEQAVRLIRGAK